MPGGQNQTGEANAERLEAPERGHLLRHLLGQALRATCDYGSRGLPSRSQVGRSAHRTARNVGRIHAGEQLDSDGTLCARRAPHWQGREASAHAEDLSLSRVARTVPGTAVRDGGQFREHGEGEVQIETLRDALDLEIESAGLPLSGAISSTEPRLVAHAGKSAAGRKPAAWRKTHGF